MFDFFKELFEGSCEGAEEVNAEDNLHLAAAALLIEIAVSDEHFCEDELKALEKILNGKMGISQPKLDSIIEQAKAEQGDATSIHQFTTLLNQHYSPVQKRDLVQYMWQIAYADGNLDKYEEYMVRKIADLVHLSHSDFILAKTRAKQEL
ncbi:TerB family tellurite resistance protein [Pseudoteredinibacter isoporae]|uniref:Putative tellurite resistance protein B-like protein n=1 Tax=Pseudoteredinibacter isoporae TaxID=570281 RepID=A0A7X0MWL5_9GAMM|nr:TerB family tellurite resistance protein [Pseudoteredinibacter isoporae]MBB6522603.1 putative tellurite resistance protein B-like protein [Pseudoteredinibacter isoporae]NHO88133.1 TerB family tellurite resistance protein [Pseudoteredinibacter isoporae]NIB23536.1 TerB family tellurite resistance protein [Pseudoteredinibacter isoporae]